MIDIQKQVNYWRDSSLEDWQVANELIRSGRFRHGLFFAQLALEKILKACVCNHTQDLAPRIHNLVRLAEIADLGLNQEQTNILAEMNPFNLEGRYPDQLMPLPSKDETILYLTRAEELYSWLTNRLF